MVKQSESHGSWIRLVDWGEGQRDRLEGGPQKDGLKSGGTSAQPNPKLVHRPFTFTIYKVRPSLLFRCHLPSPQALLCY